jgi:16S rRNA (cytidine1402-2'-O)-methyltransferase
VVTDAGTPGISDPGFLLVREAVKNGVEVWCLPGATALIPALVLSGLPTDSFAFLGFLPQKKGRQTAIKKLLEETRTVALYESPHRIHKLVEELIALGGGEKEISISREISKKFEETIRGKVLEVSERIKGKELKGEMVVVIH